MLYHDHAQTQAAKMHKLLRYSGVHCKNTETNIFVYGGKRASSVTFYWPRPAFKVQGPILTLLGRRLVEYIIDSLYSKGEGSMLLSLGDKNQ